MRLKNVDDSVINQNRFLSDLRKAQIDLENYLEKYQPYNTMVEVIKMLNQTVSDPYFFNQLVDFQSKMKKAFIHDHLERLSGRVFNLDKRRISELEVPRKKRLPVIVSQRPNQEEQYPETVEGNIDQVEKRENSLVIKGNRRLSAKGPRKGAIYKTLLVEFQGVARNIKVKARDDNLMQGIARIQLKQKAHPLAFPTAARRIT